MNLIIIGLIISGVLFLLLGLVRRDGSANRLIWRVNKKQFLSLFGLVAMVFSFFTTIPANSVGIIYSPFSGGVQDRVLGEGVWAKSPFDDVYIISTQVQDKVIEKLYGQTKDSQYLTISVDVKYYVDKSKAFDVFRKFKTLDTVNSELIMPAVKRSVEDATTSFNIIEVLGEKRPEIYKQIETALELRFAQDGITLHSVTFLDTDGGDAIEGAIAAEAVAKKNVQTAQQNKLKVQIDSETLVIQAQAEAQQKEILAHAIENSPKIIQLEWIKKWDGVLPKFMSGNDSNVMIDLGNLAQ